MQKGNTMEHDMNASEQVESLDIEVLRLRRENVALLAALEECITDDGACCMNTGQRARRLKAIDTIARDAIAVVRGEWNLGGPART